MFLFVLRIFNEGAYLSQSIVHKDLKDSNFLYLLFVFTFPFYVSRSNSLSSLASSIIVDGFDFSVEDYTSGYMPSLAMVHSNGRVFWGPVVRFRSSCKIDITYFPFDDQVGQLFLTFITCVFVDQASCRLCRLFCCYGYSFATF